MTYLTRSTAPALGTALITAALTSVTGNAQAQDAQPPKPAVAKRRPAQLLKLHNKQYLMRSLLLQLGDASLRATSPLQVISLSVENLEHAGAASLSEYLAGLPGVDVKTANGPGLGQISIRGVTTGDQTVSTVGIYVDDIPFGSSSAFAAGSTMALDMSLLDLNHIEVLRGPQGTLYGAGSMGGLLKYVTNDPDTYNLTGKVGLGCERH